jgi:hypothetical protein
MKIIDLIPFYEDADVVISDGEFSLTANAYKCQYKKGDIVTTPIYCHDSYDFLQECPENKIYENFISRYESEFFVRKIKEGEYEVSGLIVNIDKRLIKVGHIMIDIGEHYPKDLKKQS